jgi:hypothetical protein
MTQQRSRSATFASWALLLTSVFLYPWNANYAVAYGQSRGAFEAALVADIRAGMPVVFLGTKYYENLWGDPKLAAYVLENMRDHRIGPFQSGDLQLNDAEPQIVAEEALSTTPTAVHNMTKSGDYWQGDGRDSYLLFSTGSTQLVGVRLKYSLGNATASPALLEAWSDTPRTEFATSGNKFVVWGVPAHLEQQQVIAWVGDRVGTLRITPDLKATSFKLDEIVLLHGGAP